MKPVQTRKLFGARVKLFRQEQNLTLRGLAAKLDGAHTWLAQVEKGEINATLETLTRLANALDVDECDLVCFPELSIRHGCIEATRAATPDALLDARNQLKASATVKPVLATKTHTRKTG